MREYIFIVLWEYWIIFRLSEGLCIQFVMMGSTNDNDRYFLDYIYIF